jgi:hypothetical protein
MPYKNKEDAEKYYQEYYLRKFGHYPAPKIKKTKEEISAIRKAYYLANIDKCKSQAKKSREKHKEQRKLDAKKWQEENKEWSKQYHKIYNKKWYQDNKVERSLQLKSYNKAHPKECVIRTQRYNKKHPQKLKEYNRKYGLSLEGSWRCYVGSAKRRGYEYLISLEDFKNIVSKPCIYCGENEKRIGIDRIDNLKGYTKENSAPCCKLCNMMKKALTVNEFLNHIKKISQNNP